ncbi:MAG: PspA/IM30 family protein [Myxococcales bacterium]|nr:PspA/IM30 family protein [Myxococcales bacterium]
MGLWDRITTVFRSNVNEMISKAEDPEKMLNQAIVDMKGQLIEAKKQVAVAIADEKRLRRQYETEQTKATEWERKAMLAIKAGDDNLARAALQRKKSHQEITDDLKTQWEKQNAASEQLKGALRTLDSKIDEAQRKRNLLISRAKRAEAQKKINETLTGINATSAFDTFDRMSQKVEQLEAESEATYELTAAGQDADLNQQFKALEAGAGVDDDLAALKAKMLGPAPGASESPKELSAGADEAASDPVDDELAALKAQLGQS